MSFQPIRKDLTDGEKKCYFCNHSLTSLKAIIIKNRETEELFYAGEYCVTQYIDPNFTTKHIPDYTRYTTAKPSNEDEDINNKIKRNSLVDKNNLTDLERNRRKAIEYIELREEKLVKEFKTSFNALSLYYAKHLKCRLEDNEIEHILNIENKAPDKLKHLNLQKCYNYSFWIDIAIERLEDKSNSFMKDIKGYLIKNLTITEKQKYAVNKWLQHIKSVPQIR